MSCDSASAKVERAQDHSGGILRRMPVAVGRLGESARVPDAPCLLREPEALPLEVHRQEHRPARENHCALHGVLELADVPRPIMSLKEGERFGRYPSELLLRVACGVRRESIGQKRNVLDAIAQRRNFDRDHAEPKEQVAAEPAGFRFGGEIPIRRRDDSNVDLDRRRSADALELLFLEHSQQLRLEIESHLRDFIEQQSAPMRTLEGARDALDRTREGAALVAEQGTLRRAPLARPRN